MAYKDWARDEESEGIEDDGRRKCRNRILGKMNVKQKMRTKKKNQLVPVEWFIPPLKGDRLCGGCNISSIIVRQARRVP